MDFILSLIKHYELPFVVGSTIGVVLLFLVFVSLRRRSTEGRTDFSNPGEAVQPTSSFDEKSSFGDECTRAILRPSSGQTEVVFDGLVDVDVDDKFPSVVLSRKGNNDVHLELGRYDFLVCLGEQMACSAGDTCRVRVYARGELIYDEKVSDVEISEWCVKGYMLTGEDVILRLGSGLTLIVEDL
jgi:hypothetical protein